MAEITKLSVGKVLDKLRRMFSPNTLWSYAMQYEQLHDDDDNLAEIWRSAQHRRADDIYSWLTHFLERR